MSEHIDWWNHKAAAEQLLADADNLMSQVQRQQDVKGTEAAALVAAVAGVKTQQANVHALLAQVSLEAEKRL
jgi:hypothetical protein